MYPVNTEAVSDTDVDEQKNNIRARIKTPLRGVQMGLNCLYLSDRLLMTHDHHVMSWITFVSSRTTVFTSEVGLIQWQQCDRPYDLMCSRYNNINHDL